MTLKRWLGPVALASAIALAQTACNAHPRTAPCVRDSQPFVFSIALNRSVDILFSIDDSPAMSAKQAALASQIEGFVQALDQGGADYHIGLVTSDVGALPASGSYPWYSGSACGSVDGDNGTLQASPCTGRPQRDYSQAAVQTLCNTLCPVPVSPVTMTMPDGSLATSSFIASTGGPSPTTNVPGDQVAQALACMAFVGDMGCGIEGQMEAVKRALDGTTNPVANQYFLRPDALLAILYLTDKDDCSVQDRTKNDPMAIDCSPGGSSSPSWSCFNPDYRCFAEGTTCTSGFLDQPGLKSGCTPSTGSYLYDVSHYTSFFDALKLPGHLMMFGLVSPPEGPVQIDYDAGPPPSTYSLNRSTTNPACDSHMQDPITGVEIIGKPQVRLHQLLSHYPGLEHSVCDTGNYSAVLKDIANQIVSKLGKTCIPQLPASAPGAPPACEAFDQDVTTGVTTQAYPECSNVCCDALANDPNSSMTDPPVAALCAGEGSVPCWCAVQNTAACPSADSPILAAIYRGATQPPAGTTGMLTCQVQSRC